MNARLTQFFTFMVCFLFLTALNAQAPENDECLGAISLNDLFDQTLPATSGVYTNVNATTSVFEPTSGYECFAEQAGPTLDNTVWFSFTGDGNAYFISAVSCSADPFNDDTQIAIYSGDCTNLMATGSCNEDIDFGAQNYSAGTTIITEDGVEYYIMIDGWTGTTGDFCLQVEQTNIVTECNAGMLTSPDTIMVPTGGTFDLAYEGDTIPNAPVEGIYAYMFTPEGGTPNFTISNPSNPVTWDNDLGGILSANNIPLLSGTWLVQGIIFTDNSSFDGILNSICSQTEPTVLIFEIPDDPCFISTFTAPTDPITTLCFGETLEVSTDAAADSIPSLGGYGWIFSNTMGGTGGLAGGTLITGDNPLTLDADLGGILSGNGEEPLQGFYPVFAFAYQTASDPFGTICATSSDSIVVNFGSQFSAAITDNMDGSYTANPGVSNVLDFDYTWSDGQEGFTATFTESGTYSVVITETSSGCTQEASVDVTIVGVNENDIIDHLTVSPNPTSGRVNISMELPEVADVQTSVLDINGRLLMNTATERFSANNFELDLSNLPTGVYMVRFMIDNNVVTRRVTKQ